MAHKILVVDDDVAMQKLACAALTIRGFQVISAGNGAEAIRKAKSEKPDMMIMDINMPEMDGLSALEVLKKDEATRHIPILMISSLPADVVTPDAFQNGAFAFIEKPFELATLACEVRTTLAQRKS